MVNILSSAIALSLLAWTVSSKAVTIDIARKHHPTLKQAAAAGHVRAASIQPKGTSLAAGQTTSFPLVNAQFSFYMPIGLGTPIQNFSVVVDTGSSLLWIPDQSCGSVCVNAPDSFKTSQSSTFHKDNSTNLQAYYGSGNALGYMGIDTLSLNGGSFQIKNQEFGLATSQSQVTNNGVDGIIGLGPDALSKLGNSQQLQINTPITNMIEQNPSLSDVFGVKFQPVPSGYYTAMNGLIALGGLPDSSWYSGSIQWIPKITTTSAANYWGVAVDSVNFGSTPVISGLSGIVDTGTTLIIVSTAIGNALYSKIPGAAIDASSDLWSIPCASVPTLPNIAFVMNGISFQLTPSQYILPQYLNPYWGSSNSNACLSFIYPSDMSSAGYDILLGQKFLENYVSVYDTGNSRIGFAPNAQTSTTLSSTSSSTVVKTTTVKLTTTTQKATTTTQKATTTTKKATTTTGKVSSTATKTTTTKSSTTTTSSTKTSKKVTSTTKTSKKATSTTKTTTKTTPKATSTTITATSKSTAVTCKEYKVLAGDKCYLIKNKFGITAKQFYSYNPTIKSDCSNIASFVGKYICVGPPTTATAASAKTTTTKD